MLFDKFDGFLKTQLWVGIPTHLNWALVIPLVHKLQGELWTASIIAVYFVAMQVAALCVKLFAGMKLSTSYMMANVATAIMAVAMGVYLVGYEIEFLIIEALVGVIFVIAGSVHKINLDMYMIEKYKDNVIKDYKIYKEMRKSFGSLLGFSIVAIVYSEMDTQQSMWCCFVFTICMFFLKMWNWWVHYKGK